MRYFLGFLAGLLFGLISGYLIFKPIQDSIENQNPLGNSPPQNQNRLSTLTPKLELVRKGSSLKVNQNSLPVSPTGRKERFIQAFVLPKLIKAGRTEFLLYVPENRKELCRQVGVTNLDIVQYF